MLRLLVLSLLVSYAVSTAVRQKRGRNCADEEACPELPCKEEVALQGECCLYCPPGCVMEDVWYPYGPMVIEGESCEDCTCFEDGSYECLMKECPYDLPCEAEFRLEGTCCPECPPCKYREGWYGYGEVEQEDSCKTCTCAADGEVSCETNACPELPCSEDVALSGECCPYCPPGCPYNENWYGVGEMNVGDPCQQCACSDYGEVQCNEIMCDAPNCPSSVYVTSSDQCCPGCPPGCNYENNWYGPGSMENAEQCASCECAADGGIACVPYACAPLPCPAEVQYTADGDCCPSCPSGCDYESNWYGATVDVPSDNPCETCTCGDNGQVDCVRNPCEQPTCSSDYSMQLRADYSCCPECLKSCKYRGESFVYGADVPTSRNCRTCHCGDNGRVRCSRVPCEPLVCPDTHYPYTEYLECCPTCKPKRK